MAPKPRPVQRKTSTTAGNMNSLQKTPNPQSMPPPPVPGSIPSPAPPAPAPPPRGLLVPETAALSDCLRSAVVKTGQIYRFYSDTKKLGIHRYTPYPTRAMVSSLGREVERYDQLCDAIQLQLERAITVLKRDLKREQDRLKAAEVEAAARAAAAAAPPPPKSPLISPTQEPESMILSPTTPSARGPTLAARRQSTISLSSLQRPPMPHKLDLSSLRLDPNDLSIMQSGMASPVTLAPKSSLPRATDFSFDPSQDVDIDLTIGEDVIPPPEVSNTALGSSADKPIELDLDMDIFGGNSHVDADMSSGDMGMTGGPIIKQEEPIDLDLFSGLTQDETAKSDAALLVAAQAIPPPQDPSLSVLPQASSSQAQGQPANSSGANAQSSDSMLEVFGAVTSSHDGATAPTESDNFDFNFDLMGESEFQQLLALSVPETAPPS